MKTILVPTDFSEASRNASIYAAEFAKAAGYKVILYHTYFVPIVISSDVTTSVMLDPIVLKEENEERIAKETAYITEKTGLHITTLLTEGNVVDEILEIERTQKLEMIIMGISESGGLSEFMIGSVATDVIQKSLVSVMIIPLKAEFKPFKKIVFAADYSLETDIHLLDPLKDFSKMFYSKLFILNIVKEIELVGVEKEVSRMRIQNYLEDLEHTHYYMEDDDIIHGLNEFIDEYNIDVITMLPHKHNLFSRVFKESKTKKMAFHTHIPLLTLPSRIF